LFCFLHLLTHAYTKLLIYVTHRVLLWWGIKYGMFTTLRTARSILLVKEC